MLISPCDSFRWTERATVDSRDRYSSTQLPCFEGVLPQTEPLGSTVHLAFEVESRGRAYDLEMPLDEIPIMRYLENTGLRVKLPFSQVNHSARF